MISKRHDNCMQHVRSSGHFTGEVFGNEQGLEVDAIQPLRLDGSLRVRGEAGRSSLLVPEFKTAHSQFNEYYFYTRYTFAHSKLVIRQIGEIRSSWMSLCSECEMEI